MAEDSGDSLYPSREPVAIDGFVIDATLSEGHEHPSEVTKFPVEKGVDITDNIRPEPITITLDCVVSDTPIGRIAVSRAQDAGLAAQLDTTADSPSAQAYSHMMTVRGRREPVLVQTSLRDFPSMALTNLSVPRKSGEPNAIHFTATFAQIEVVQNERRAVQIAQAKTSLGSRSPSVKFASTVVWRVGSPPGGDAIIDFRYVLFGKKPNGKWAYFRSTTVATPLAGPAQGGAELTAQEQRDFSADFQRDYWTDIEGAQHDTVGEHLANRGFLPLQYPTRRGNLVRESIPRGSAF